MTSINLMESITDEVALEGLDGITLQALWIRLANRFHDSLPLSKILMEQVWSICKLIKGFLFYKLKTPRKPLVLYDRYEFVDPDLGIICEPSNIPADIYPHCPIQDRKVGVRGSCSTYYTRQEITTSFKKISLDEVTEKYGLSLVIVASQKLRTEALLDTEVLPKLELTIMHYCFLERLGRSRYHGEVTQGKNGLAALKQNPKSLFYLRKFLMQHKLITKQIHYQKSGNHCGTGSLLHLPRFYVKRKPKMIYLAEQVIEILRSKENGVADCDEIKKKLGIKNSIKKLFRTSFFQKIVKTNISVPYRTLYPDAKPNEWQRKHDTSKEKKIKVVQLLYPDVNITDVWNKEEKDDEDDFDEMHIINHRVNNSYIQQTNTSIEMSELEGLSQTNLGADMGLTKLHSRSMLRNLVKTKIVATYMNDIGRQRITRYVSKKFEKNSKMSKQFNKEMHKIKKFTIEIANENKEKLKKKSTSQAENETSFVQHEHDLEQIKNDISHSDDNDQVDVSIKSLINDANENGNKNKDKDKDAYYSKKNIELKNTFYIINRIIYKYKLSKFIPKYKCTSSFLLLKMKNPKLDMKQQESKSKDALTKSLQQIVNDTKTKSLYNSIKMNLTAQKPVCIEKRVNEVHGFMDILQNSEKSNSNITYRLLRRANMIIEAVKEHHVIDDMAKLMKLICEEEIKEGYNKKIDKKSLIRLLQKLAKDNLVKNMKLTLSANGHEKNLTFICDPIIDTDHTIIKSAVEQAKVKFCLLTSQKAKVASKMATKQEKIDKSDSKEKLEFDKMLSKNTLPSINYKYDVKAGKRYGLSPKFIRMQTMHALLFYLIYDHQGMPKISQQEQVNILRVNNYEIDDKLIQEFSTIYSTEVNWKMFVPPLPKHTGWPKGWALMCDVLLGLPLSVFVKVHNITFIIPELDYYLNHPIRKHYLIKNIPITIRNTLLHARKYIYNIHDTITRLAYIGLVQFGPQRLKDKDQVFIYVNRRTELMDTVSSAPSYHKIEDKPYTVSKYFFNHTQDVEKYWYDMWAICVNTPLGGRLVVHGKDILLEDLNKKTAMIEAITARTPKETVQLDTGTVPGDRKGAAGIDSAFFAHLKRNWNWSPNYSTLNQQASNLTKNQNKLGTSQRDLHLSKIQMNPVKYTEYDGLKKISGPPAPALNAVELQKKVFDHLSNTERKNEALPSHQSKKQKSFVRRVMPRKTSARPRLKYDEDDYRALQRMDKLRVDWDSHEDNILLVCKVATMYLSPNPRKQMVGFIAVRDVLRTFSYSSYNKTSRACQRRLMYMLKQSRTMNSVALGVEEIKQDSFVNRRYGGIMERLKNDCATPAEYEKRVTEVFKELVAYIVKKYYDIAEIKPKKHMNIPKTKQQFDLFFELVHPANPRHNQGFTKDVHNTNDIHSATINSVIHSSMCCGKDRRCWAYQLFKVYQQYSEVFLRQAMSKIRADQMVTVKKHHLAAIKKYGNYMPMSSAQYQLSINYIHKLQTKWPYSMFKECYEILAKLLLSYAQHRNISPSQEQKEVFNGIEILPVSSGIIAVMHDLLACEQIDFEIEMPDQIIMLDARYKGKDDTYFRVAQRYQDILTRLYRFKYENIENQNAKLEIEMQEIHKDCLKRKKTDENDENPEEGKAKIFRMNEENGERQGEGSQQNNAIMEKESVQYEELTQKNHLSRKRCIDAEEDSMDCEEPILKRARLNSEDSIDQDMEEHEKLSVCEDLEDIDKMCVSESSESTKELKAQETEEIPFKHLNSSTEAATAPRRVNEIIRSMQHEMSYLGPYSKINNSNDMQKKYTRIAMLRMKEELNDFTAESHHAHEFFVVNSFKMFYSLDISSSSASNNDVIDFKGHSVPVQFLPLKIETVNNYLGEINRLAVFPKNGISYADYKDDVTMKKLEVAINWKHADAVYKFVREKKDIGVCPQELLDNFFTEQGTELYDIVSFLTKNRIFLRAGVTKPRYIHHRYVNPWLIHSYKIYRLEQESVVPFKDSIYATALLEEKTEKNIETNAEYNEEINKKPGETDAAIPSTSTCDNREIQQQDIAIGNEKADNKDISNEEDDKKDDSEMNEESDVHARRRMHRQRTCLLPQRDVYKSAQQLDFTTAEEIKVVIKPWIRIDGTLNRKVLDRMLGAILSYCLLHPGLTMAKVQSRFIPVLQPFHTRELLEMLITLECLNSKLLKKTHVTLFSKPTTIKLSNLSADTVGWSAEDEIVLEPAVDSMLKFSIFLSTKLYSTDFIP